MSALAHYLEQAGIATIVISLIREHSLAIRPPRALWVPFDLGRPLGVPGDAAFQTRVLQAALALLERQSGPVHEDYPHDAPAIDESAQEGWSCPVSFATADAADEGSLRQRLQKEFLELAPWYELAMERSGRTTVGASELTLPQKAALLGHLLEAEPDQAPTLTQPMAVALRFVVDDLKAYYSEAAAAQPGQASASALADWLWDETLLGQSLLRLQLRLCDSDDAGLQRFASSLLIPRTHSDRLEALAARSR